MWRKHFWGAVVAAALVSLGGCATSFTGDAQFPGGALGCYNQCEKIKMEMATFVYVGEYSTACACRPKVAAPITPTLSSGGDTEGATVAAAAGVEMQRRRAEAAAQQQQFHPAPITVGH